MSCEHCEEFDTEIPIQSPSSLARVAGKIRTAVTNGKLSYNSFESSRELVGQPSFLELDLSEQIPDVIRYHFQCPHCGTCFGLFVEAYHGSGGKWFTSGRVAC